MPTAIVPRAKATLDYSSLSDAERERYRRWWVKRSGLEPHELTEIAEMIWPSLRAVDAISTPERR